MTLDEILRDVHALRENLLVFERKYGVPSEMFFEAYSHGEEPEDSAWVLDWSEWAATYEILQERLSMYNESVRKAKLSSFSQLVERTSRHESIPIAG